MGLKPEISLETGNETTSDLEWNIEISTSIWFGINVRFVVEIILYIIEET